MPSALISFLQHSRHYCGAQCHTQMHDWECKADYIIPKGRFCHISAKDSEAMRKNISIQKLPFLPFFFKGEVNPNFLQYLKCVYPCYLQLPASLPHVCYCCLVYVPLNRLQLGSKFLVCFLYSWPITLILIYINRQRIHFPPKNVGLKYCTDLPAIFWSFYSRKSVNLPEGDRQLY